MKLRATASVVGKTEIIFTKPDVAGDTARSLGFHADRAEFDHVIVTFHDSHSLALLR